MHAQILRKLIQIIKTRTKMLLLLKFCEDFFFSKEALISSRPNILRNPGVVGQSGAEGGKFMAFKKISMIRFSLAFLIISASMDSKPQTLLAKRKHRRM